MLHRHVGKFLRVVQVAVGIGLVTEGARGQPRELAGVAVRKPDHYAIRRQAREARNGVGGEAGLGLFAVGDDRRSGRFEQLDGFANRAIVERVELRQGQASSLERLDPFDQRLRPWNASDRFSGNRHAKTPPSHLERMSTVPTERYLTT